MEVSARIRRILKIILIVIVIAFTLFVLTAEIDRRRCRTVACSSKMFYEGGHWLTASVNLFVAAHVKRKADLNPYPSLKDNFPRHDRLRSKWQLIRDEVLQLYNTGQMKEIKHDLFFRNIADDKWKRFYIKWYGPSLEEAHQKLPLTTNLVDSLPELQSAMISVLEPGSRITPHVGPYRGVLRYHLGLKTPTDAKNCWIRNDGVEYNWHDGEDVLFDDTYVHEVYNNTKELRVILFCDVQRDLNCHRANRVMNFFSTKVASITTRNNK
jgi:beta-hydroxylase